MFKRNPRSYLRIVAEFFYPRGGWYRAAQYVIHRLRRLPDPAHRISRGIAAGVFASFTPFYGLHFLTAAILSWLVRGNVLASLLATFVGNPLTFPLIAELCVNLGHAMMGQNVVVHLPEIVSSFAGATNGLWANFKSIFTDDIANWSQIHLFYDRVFLPYLVGCLIPGIAAGTVAYVLANPLIHAYQRRRINKLKTRYEKRMAERFTKGGDPTKNE
ncbi:hypothetical protein SAMN04488030_3249 [Aliiroseovarius halocynthiae]|uniref:DUF2062 domain-containing protein n=1 Tax=Aliiroseovarius halocynthiae TaxID=985055 RepID=A0A545SN10_9RHOB|nr:DUF2062 domain-containing protein [Aliiroseovarius halocynthiae]TQV66359.1 DUF2062 domain-containing protein [Aliiroseovarius halocynthiae]SMR83332.1 hypothetical protein SAMN04488030_3249 [Aliiroseovarius halocynthiae]